MTPSDPTADPRALIDQVQQAAGEPPLVPLSLSEPPSSLRPGRAGRVVTRVRRGIIRLIAPSLLELIGQLEHDRHATRRRIADLEARIAELEANRTTPAP